MGQSKPARRSAVLTPMTLTALDPHSLPQEVVILPFDEGKTKGMCRDNECRGELTAVNASVIDGEILRMSHWRHKVASGCKSSALGRDADSKTPWHVAWQLTCTDPERIEYRHKVVGALRVADVMARYDWAIEFQHSTIPEKTIADRERHYLGKLIWVVDATALGTSASPDEYRGAFRWTHPPAWVSHTKALIAVDSGECVHVLPPGYQMERIQQSILVAMAYVKRYTREQFVDQWVNGNEHPIGQDFATKWTLENLERELARREKSAHERLARNSAEKRALESEVCGYKGGREIIELDAQRQSASDTWRKARHQPFVMSQHDRAVALVMNRLGGVVIEERVHEVSS